MVSISFKTLITVLILMVSSILNIPALDNQIIIETWYEIEQYSNWEYEETLNIDLSEPEESKTHEMLDEARIILSSMIYGYSFSYIPQDNARGVKDWFNLEPIEEINWGDPQLEILFSERRENRIYCKILYNLSDYQLARRSSWYSNSIPYSTGRGQEDYFIGSFAKLLSINNSIKEAIRNYARSTIPNKPREIKGEVLVWDAPYTIIESGTYSSTVRIKLLILEIIPYTIF